MRLRIGSLAPCLALTVLTACSSLTVPPADLVIVNGKEPESLDPAIISGQADGRVVSSLFEGLTRYNARTGDPEPGLAAEWSVSDDGKEYRFRIRENLSWSDGSPLTIHDIVYSWRRVLEPATVCEYAGILDSVHNARAYHHGQLKDFRKVGLRIVSPNELVVTLNHPTPFFPEICAFPVLATVPRQPIEQHGDRWLLQPDIPTSGAFTLRSWRLNDRIRLRKNPHYWDQENTRSEVVDLLPTSDPGVALNLYETEVVDIIWDKELIPAELVRTFLQRADFHVTDNLGVFFLRINTTQAPFHDRRVRQALALAIDRERIVNKITGAGERSATSLVPPGIPGYAPPQGLGHDPERARELLRLAGFPGGEGLQPIDYLYNSSRLNEKIAIEIQSMWQNQLGIKTELRPLEWKSYLKDQRELRYGVSRSSWMGDYLDPLTFLDVFGSHNGNNRTGWRNSTYDSLLAQAERNNDATGRMARLRQAETLLVSEEIPIIPLYFNIAMEGYRSDRVKGIWPNFRAEHPVRAIYRSEPASETTAPTPARQ